jgi:hypothetical protein
MRGGQAVICRARALALAAFVGATLSGCGWAVAAEPDADGNDGGSLDDGAAVADGAMDSGIDARPTQDAATSVDFGPRDFGGGNDDGVCRPGPGVCNTLDDCVAWAAAVGPPGTYVDTRCAYYHCTPGTECFMTAEGLLTCSCGGTSCRFDELCVADTPGGTPRCVQECVGR